MQVIISDKIPHPKGHYSTCIQHNGLIYISGQLPFHLKTREKPTGIEQQTLLVLENIALILNEAGSNKNQIIQMRLYIPDMKMWDDVNKVYSEFFSSHKPVRCIVPTRDLHYGCLIEMEATAYIEE